MAIIYCYTNLINNKKYIGQTINPQQRFNAHKSAVTNTTSAEYDAPIHRAMRKYGYENFEYSVLAQLNDDRDIDLLNEIERYYISKFDSRIPNGYNILQGGKNSDRPSMEFEEKERRIWDQAELSKEEVIELRKAFANKMSPKQIYDAQYKNRLHFQSFMNIWTGKRYGLIMPEVFENRSHTKLNEDIVRAIRRDRAETGASYQKLADKYSISKATIADIVNLRTWKHIV